jgi:furin
VPVWKQGIDGTGVVISIVDDGLEKSHPDIEENYDPQASYDFNGNDKDPSPRRTFTNENDHGTRCAGLVAAVKNKLCIVGAAFKARIGGIRMLDGDVTDLTEAKSLGFNSNHIDIYSCSWGPKDDGETVEAIGRVAELTIKKGVTSGRNGLGSIYVWASGNGGLKGDSCGCDGYANSIYTISVSSVTSNDRQPWYSESCASTLVSTYSSGSAYDVATVDLDHSCTNSFSGTSASASITAGLVALALQANPALTWRDVQHVLIRSAKMVDPHNGHWQKNGVGRNVSHKYGYGIIDAEMLVNLSRSWKRIPEKNICEHRSPERDIKIEKSTAIIKMTVKACKRKSNEVKVLEHVEVRVTLKVKKRGTVSLTLRSPRGTRSTLLPFRRRDTSKRGFLNWTFMTTHCWGESPRGKWRLKVYSNSKTTNITLVSWTLVLHGTNDRLAVPP